MGHDDEIDDERHDTAALAREILDRVEALGGPSDRELARKTGMDRSTVAKVLNGREVRRSTLLRFERGLRDLEEEMGQLDHEPSSTHDASIRISASAGIDIVVSGPIENLAELEASALRLMKQAGLPKTD